MRDERGFAIVAAALLIALSFFFSMGAIVVFEHSRMIEEAVRAQQLEAARLQEHLKIVATENGFEVINKGAVPSVVVSFVVQKPDGSFVIEGNKSLFVASDSTFSFTPSSLLVERWWNKNWSKKITITIISPSCGIPGGYSMQIWENEAYRALKWRSGMKADFSDIRFVWENADGFFVCPHWIESYVSGENALVWVRLPNDVALAPNSPVSNLKLYFGNSAAPDQSNGNAVFEFFDDFSGSVLDTAKWTKVDSGGYISVQNGELVITNGTASWGQTGIYSVQDFARNNLEVRLKYRTTLVNGSSYRDTTMLVWKDAGSGANYTDFIYALYFYSTSSSGGTWQIYEDGSSRSSNTGSFTPNTQYWVSQVLKPSGGATYRTSTDGSSFTTLYDSTYSTETPLKVGLTHYQGGIVYVDYILVRKCLPLEPLTHFAENFELNLSGWITDLRPDASFTQSSAYKKDGNFSGLLKAGTQMDQSSKAVLATPVYIGSNVKLYFWVYSPNAKGWTEIKISKDNVNWTQLWWTGYDVSGTWDTYVDVPSTFWNSYVYIMLVSGNRYSTNRESYFDGLKLVSSDLVEPCSAPRFENTVNVTETALGAKVGVITRLGNVFWVE